MGFRASAPAPNLGYNRNSDWPNVGLAGAARVDGLTVGVGGGVNLKTNNGGTATGSGQWHPTVMYMLGFVVVELVVFHLLSRYMNI